MRKYVKLQSIVVAFFLLFTSHTTLCNELVLNGRGIAEKFQSDYFMAALYVDEVSTTPSTLLSSDNFRMEMSVLVDEWSKRQFTQHWNQAIFINNSTEEREHFSLEATRLLGTLKGSLKYGDQLTIKKSNNRATLIINGVELYSSTKAGLSNLFLNTWIGARPPSSEFKSSILGIEPFTRTDFAEFGDINPKRIAEIKKWVATNRAPQQKSSTSEKLPDRDISLINDSSGLTNTQILLAEQTQPGLSMPEQSGKIFTSTDESSVDDRNAERPISPETNTLLPADKDTPPDTSLTQYTSTKSKSAAVVEVDELTERKFEQQFATKESVESTEPIDPLLKIYRSNILTLTYQNLIYPTSAINRKQEDKILLKLTLDRKGRVKNIQYDQKSRYTTLNKAVDKAIEQASPYPDPPKNLKGKEIVVDVPIVFSLSS